MDSFPYVSKKREIDFRFHPLPVPPPNCGGPRVKMKIKLKN
jgi:hypothetical protein